MIHVPWLCLNWFSLIDSRLKSTVFCFWLVLKPFVILFTILFVSLIKSPSLIVSTGLSHRMGVDFRFESALLVLMLLFNFHFLLLLVLHVLIKTLHNLWAGAIHISWRFFLCFLVKFRLNYLKLSFSSLRIFVKPLFHLFHYAWIMSTLLHQHFPGLFIYHWTMADLTLRLYLLLNRFLLPSLFIDFVDHRKPIFNRSMHCWNLSNGVRSVAFWCIPSRPIIHLWLLVLFHLLNFEHWRLPCCMHLKTEGIRAILKLLCVQTLLYLRWRFAVSNLFWRRVILIIPLCQNLIHEIKRSRYRIDVYVILSRSVFFYSSGCRRPIPVCHRYLNFNN